ncbi:MAG: carboxypeptidase regulatory-like domain-containing protein, partial [Candidatus Poribacteria bacterium]
AQNSMDGIHIDSTSSPDIGTEEDPGLNEIHHNGNYDVYSDSSAEIKAELNWWGQAPPNPAYIHGNIDYDPWLTEPPHPGKGSINGHVTDCGTGDPIERAFVIAVQKPTKVWALTDADGYYQISDLEPGVWWLIGIKKGYKPHIAKVEVEAGVPTTHDFCMEPK